ncbi:MAG: HgcAB-associated protein HgcC [Dehalococcoidales bacterium]
MTERSEPKSMARCETKSMLKGMKCCKVDALISIDARGQIVLPKDVRERVGVKAGDKFLVISYESEGKVCCLFLVKAEDFVNTAKDMLGPMVKEILE